MAIPLQSTLVREIIARRFGCVDDLVVEWEERVMSGLQRRGRARNRATIYRWLDEGLPGSKDDVLGFAAVLDVDPVSLLHIDQDFVSRHYGRERRLLQLGQLGRSHLGAFWPIYMPGPGWPDPALARDFYGRDWYAREHRHDPGVAVNVFALLRIKPTGNRGPNEPHVVHFAYRRVGARDMMWRPYGAVLRTGHRLLLISESGDLQERTLSNQQASFAVETFFGPGAADFRLVSLHPFELHVAVPSPGGDHARFAA